MAILISLKCAECVPCHEIKRWTRGLAAQQAPLPLKLCDHMNKTACINILIQHTSEAQGLSYGLSILLARKSSQCSLTYQIPDNISPSIGPFEFWPVLARFGVQKGPKIWPAGAFYTQLSESTSDTDVLVNKVSRPQSKNVLRKWPKPPPKKCIFHLSLIIKAYSKTFKSNKNKNSNSMGFRGNIVVHTEAKFRKERTKTEEGFLIWKKKTGRPTDDGRRTTDGSTSDKLRWLISSAGAKNYINH